MRSRWTLVCLLLLTSSIALCDDPTSLDVYRARNEASDRLLYAVGNIEIELKAPSPRRDYLLHQVREIENDLLTYTNNGGTWMTTKSPFKDRMDTALLALGRWDSAQSQPKQDENLARAMSRQIPIGPSCLDDLIADAKRDIADREKRAQEEAKWTALQKTDYFIIKFYIQMKLVDGALWLTERGAATPLALGILPAEILELSVHNDRILMQKILIEAYRNGGPNLDKLYAQLSKSNPDAMAKLGKNGLIRVIRAENESRALCKDDDFKMRVDEAERLDKMDTNDLIELARQPLKGDSPAPAQ